MTATQLITTTALAVTLTGCASVSSFDPTATTPYNCRALAAKMAMGAKPNTARRTWDVALEACRIGAGRTDPFPARPYQPQRRRKTITITWHPVTLDQLSELGGKALPYHFGRLRGLALPRGDSCDIYAAEPRRTDGFGMTVLGHEVAHCFRGAYHGASRGHAPPKEADWRAITDYAATKIREVGMPPPLFANHHEEEADENE